MPLQATSGAASYDAFGGGAAAVPTFVEDVFSTYLYTGTDALNTITNGIDLSTKGGLVWCKGRNLAGYNNSLMSTAFSGMLFSDATNAASDYPTDINSYNTNGFTLKASTNYDNISGTNYVSWTFRKQPKFFDVVTYTGNGSTQNISHNLGSKPGFIIVKRTDDVGSWITYHQALGASYRTILNTTSASNNSAPETFWGDTVTAVEPTTTQFTVGYQQILNGTGMTYVAYLFAHNAGGFGLTGTDNVISCGTVTADGSGGVTVNLGYEPQWIMYKMTNRVTPWTITDNMRGWHPQTIVNPRLYANASDAETTSNDQGILSTGFNSLNNFSAGDVIIYIAIRRGPMKVPTSGTSVFSPNATTATENTKITTGFPVDLQMQGYRTGLSVNQSTVDRLRGVGTLSPTSANPASPRLITSSTAAEATASVTNGWDNTGFQISSGWDGNNMIYWNFRRAPSFFDEVCYTGTGSTHAEPHNLQKLPEMVICKSRGVSGGWLVGVNNAVGSKAGLFLNQTAANSGNFNASNDSTTGFDVEAYGANVSGRTYVAYLFATAAGVSKVGSYTGNGSSQTINCGFTSGARFVLIKRTDSTGDWMVSDSARGIVSGSDPYLELNNTNAEVTGEDWLDTDSTGFVVNEVSGSNANTSSATYIFLAIA